MATKHKVLISYAIEDDWAKTYLVGHAIDRVADVEAVAAGERDKGRPIKDRVEVSVLGRVRQTALRAVTISRLFVDADDATIRRDVPGSFYEFITRNIDPATGALDLAFDSGNATGIFAMTRAA